MSGKNGCCTAAILQVQNQYFGFRFRKFLFCFEFFTRVDAISCGEKSGFVLLPIRAFYGVFGDTLFPGSLRGMGISTWYGAFFQYASR